MNIKQLRKVTGLTQKKFSERFKIPLRTVQNWESGTNAPAEYIPRLIEMVMILENEIDKLRSGQLIFGAEAQPDPEQEKQPKEEKDTETVSNWTEKEKLASNILAYLDDINDINCEDCIYYGDTEGCKENDCIMQNHKQYKEIVELIGRGAK